MSFRVDRRRSTIAGIAVATLALAAFVAFHLPWTLNTSASLPIGIYRTEAIAGPLRRGETAVVCPPPAVASLARERGYAIAGRCPGGVVAFLKLIAAVAGDSVDVRRDGVYVRGVRLPNSRFYRIDYAGNPLPQLAKGERVLRPGTLWLYTPHPGGFDSRYFGAVPVSAVRARARMLVQLAPWPYASDLPAAPP